MRKVIAIIFVVLMLGILGPVFAGGDKLYVHSTEVLSSINANSGVSTLNSVPSVCEMAYIGTSGESIYWLAGGMSGAGTSGRGIVLDPSVTQPLVLYGIDIIKDLQFGSCSTSATTVFVIYMHKP